MFFAEYDTNQQLFVSMPEGGGNAEVLGSGKEALWECMRRNDKGLGAFITVQGFKDNRRITENLAKINGWAIDIDEGSKPDMFAKLEASPLHPTTIVETKRGYHAYWSAYNPKVENFKDIQERLVAHFGADNKAKDLCRFLRLPCCYHWKDPQNPFLIEVRKERDNKFTDSQMLLAFKPVVQNRFTQHTEQAQRTFSTTHMRGQWQGNVRGLELLSGAGEINGDIVTFKPNSNGTRQIWCNGKSTEAWIARDGHIASRSHAGPGLVNWVMFYGHTREQAREILKKYLGNEFESIMRGESC